MNASIAFLIHTFHGYFYETAGVIEGFFDDPFQAHACAGRIRDELGKEVDVCGDQLSVWL